ARATAQRVAQRLRRRLHIVEQPELTQVAGLRETETEQGIVESLSDEIEEFDLLPHLDAHAAVLDLTFRQARLRQQRPDRNTRLLRPRIGKAGHSSHRGRNRTKRLAVGFTHGSTYFGGAYGSGVPGAIGG